MQQWFAMNYLIGTPGSTLFHHGDTLDKDSSKLFGVNLIELHHVEKFFATNLLILIQEGLEVYGLLRRGTGDTEKR